MSIVCFLIFRLCFRAALTLLHAVVLDVYLSPASFPSEPPKVHFHSYALTRLSPNLYSEGKVCLSLLNTWAGEKSETWSAAKSSLLQVIISISALVMVPEPYYTEVNPFFHPASSIICHFFPFSSLFSNLLPHILILPSFPSLIIYSCV